MFHKGGTPMKRLPTSFVVVMALALWLGSAAAVSAKEYTVDGTITKIDTNAKTFDLQCSDPAEKWPNLHVAEAELKSLAEWKDKKTVLTVIIDRQGDRYTAISIKPQNE
jgi:hypothetical protein